MVDYNTGKSLDDPSFVNWYVSLTTYKNSMTTEKLKLKIHKCTEADYLNFFPPIES